MENSETRLIDALQNLRHELDQLGVRDFEITIPDRPTHELLFRRMEMFSGGNAPYLKDLNSAAAPAKFDIYGVSFRQSGDATLDADKFTGQALGVLSGMVNTLVDKGYFTKEELRDILLK